MDDLEDHFWKKPTVYHNYYNMRICGYVDLACSILGIITNAFIFLVLTNKDMVSPLNTIFKHIVLTETVAAIAYVPRAWHECFRVEKCNIGQHRTRIWERVSLNAYLFAFTFRQIGVWMAVMLGIWRYIAVLHPLKEREWCNMEMTRKCILVGYISIMSGAVMIPFIVIGSGKSVKLVDEHGCPTSNITIGRNITIYEIKTLLEDNFFWYSSLSILCGVGLKLLPIMVFTFISCRLIYHLLSTEEHRKEIVSISKRQNTYNVRMKKRITQQTNQATKLLILMLITFIIGELPHGIFLLINAYYGPKFFWKYYYYAMEIFNCITYVCESFNFLIFYFMSPQFRKIFKNLFKFKSQTINPPIVPESESNSTTRSVTTSLG